MPPEVRYFILADQVSASQNNLQRINIQGLVTYIRAKGAPFPLVHPLFHILLLLTNGSGSGDLSARIVYDPTTFVVFRTSVQRIRFSGPLDEVMSGFFRVQNCSFPNPGLYFVECLFDGTVIARQPLTVTR